LLYGVAEQGDRLLITDALNLGILIGILGKSEHPFEDGCVP
jgi:hypothetical protein